MPIRLGRCFPGVSRPLFTSGSAFSKQYHRRRWVRNTTVLDYARQARNGQLTDMYPLSQMRTCITGFESRYNHMECSKKSLDRAVDQGMPTTS